MSITKTLVGTRDGADVYLFALENKQKTLKAEILNYGGIIKSLVFDGVDVVLGRDNLEEYFNNEGYFGALIGRNSNRIDNGKFAINGVEYSVAKNDNGVCNLHGGNVGFDKKVWDYELIDGDQPGLELAITSPDGEEGFPGNVNVKVTYTVTSENSLKIHYEAVTDADTIINMTNHSYFNLNGHKSGTVDGHKIQISASYFTPNTPDCYPDGSIIRSAGTPFDLTQPTLLGERIKSDYEQIKMFGGYDHNFVLDGEGYRKIAAVVGDKTGICMDCYTDLSAVQLYTGNMIEKGRVCKDGAVYDVHHAFCLETQSFPNAVNYPHFPSPIVKKDEIYDTTTEYKFYK